MSLLRFFSFLSSLYLLIHPDHHQIQQDRNTGENPQGLAHCRHHIINGSPITRLRPACNHLVLRTQRQSSQRQTQRCPKRCWLSPRTTEHSPKCGSNCRASQEKPHGFILLPIIQRILAHSVPLLQYSKSFSVFQYIFIVYQYFISLIQKKKVRHFTYHTSFFRRA